MARKIVWRGEGTTVGISGRVSTVVGEKLGHVYQVARGEWWVYLTHETISPFARLFGTTHGTMRDAIRHAEYMLRSCESWRKRYVR